MAARLLLVWWSMTGGTRQLVEAAARAAGQACAQAAPGEGGPVEVLSLAADRVGADQVLGASAYLFATPENLGSMAGMMKDFFDRTYYAALERINGRPYASIVCAGSDGQGAVRQIDRIATGWRLRRVAPPLLVITGAQSPQDILAPKTIAAGELARAAELGAALSTGLSLGIW